MPRYAKETHPLHQKFEALADKARDLKIRIHVEGNEFVITDEETHISAVICDIEPGQFVWDIPPSFEFRLRILEK